MEHFPFVAARTVLVLEHRGVDGADTLAGQFRRDVGEYARQCWELVSGDCELAAAFGDAPLPTRFVVSREPKHLEQALHSNAAVVAVPPLHELVLRCSTLCFQHALPSPHQTVRVKLLLRSAVAVDELMQRLLAFIPQPREGMLHIDLVSLFHECEVTANRFGRIRVCSSHVPRSSAPQQQRLLQALGDLKATRLTVLHVPLRGVGGDNSATQFEGAVNLVMGDSDQQRPLSFAYRGVFNGKFGPYDDAKLVTALDKPATALLAHLRAVRAVCLALDGCSVTTHLLQWDGARNVIRSLTTDPLVLAALSEAQLLKVGSLRGKKAASAELCLNYAHSSLLRPHLAVLTPVLVTRSTPLLLGDRAQGRALAEAANALMVLRATDADDAWAQLENAPQSRQIAWNVLMGELLAAQQACPALASLSLFVSSSLPFQVDGSYTLHSALASMRPVNPGVDSGRTLYPGLPDKPPRFGGGDGE